jgi:3-isopropylmalate dehydratase small subunit
MLPNTSWLKDLAISETGLIFDPSTGSIFTANTTGVQILMAMKEGKDAAQIKASLVEEFEVDANKAEIDIQDFLNQLTTSCPEKK